VLAVTLVLVLVVFVLVLVVVAMMAMTVTALAGLVVLVVARRGADPFVLHDDRIGCLLGEVLAMRLASLAMAILDALLTCEDGDRVDRVDPAVVHATQAVEEVFGLAKSVPDQL